jgi:phage baseplate assembly protein W
MSWSLQISGGDLSFGANGLNKVTSTQKLVQDLSCGLLTPYGSDDRHPTYGSTLSDNIGSINGTASATFVNAEISRVCQNYQRQQIARNNADISSYGRSTLSLGEALLSVDSIQTQTLETTMQVTVNMTTGQGSVSTTTMVS